MGTDKRVAATGHGQRPEDGVGKAAAGHAGRRGQLGKEVQVQGAYSPHDDPEEDPDEDADTQQRRDHRPDAHQLIREAPTGRRPRFHHNPTLQDLYMRRNMNWASTCTR